MGIPKIVEDVIQFVSGAVEKAIQFVSGAVVRIFSPSDDDYPASGVQPYDGIATKKHHSKISSN
jgi:hypothetical protein